MAERSRCLCGLFFVAGVLLYARAAESPARTRAWFLALALLSGVLSALSKEIGITVFGVYVAFDLMIPFRSAAGKSGVICWTVNSDEQGLRHALGDTYCDDWAVQDPEWIASTMLSQVSDGSVIIVHMPEKGFRPHLLRSLELLLDGLSARGYECATLSELSAAG